MSLYSPGGGSTVWQCIQRNKHILTYIFTRKHTQIHTHTRTNTYLYIFIQTHTHMMAYTSLIKVLNPTRNYSIATPHIIHTNHFKYIHQ